MNLDSIVNYDNHKHNDKLTVATRVCASRAAQYI